MHYPITYENVGLFSGIILPNLKGTNYCIIENWVLYNSKMCIGRSKKLEKLIFTKRFEAPFWKVFFR